MIKYILILFLSGMLFAKDIFINGRVMAFSETGEEQPKKDISLNILYTNNNTKSDEKGFFHFVLDGNKYTSGTKIRMKVENTGWYIYAPSDGIFYLPKNLEDFDLKVKVVMNNSRIKNSYFNIHVNASIGKNKSPKPVIQIASFRNEKSAKKVLKDIKSKHYNKAFIKKIDSQYKVFISIFRTKKEANKFLKFFAKKYKKQYDSPFVTLVAL